jgi:hypothetical protein
LEQALDFKQLDHDRVACHCRRVGDSPVARAIKTAPFPGWSSWAEGKRASPDHHRARQILLKVRSQMERLIAFQLPRIGQRKSYSVFHKLGVGSLLDTEWQVPSRQNSVLRRYKSPFTFCRRL